MEKKQSGQVIAVVALLVAVVGLAIGFSAFSNVLKIQSNAKVTPDANTLNVDFSSSSAEVLTDKITPTSDPVGVVATEATIDNSSDPTISNLHATFTEPGQKAIYKFYAYNAGELEAYLKSIVYGNVTSENTNKVCTAAQGTTDALVQKACSGISVKVKVGASDETSTGISSITNHSLAKGNSELVTVTLEYAANADRADGDFTVSFGDITLNYSSVD